MATFPLKLSRNDQRAVIYFFFGQKDLMQMRFTLRCVQCMATSFFTRPTIYGVWSLLAAEKALLIRNERPGRHVATTDATIATVDAFVQSDGTNVWRNLDDMLKNETLMFNIYWGNINLLSLFVFFSFLCCLSLVSYDRNWWRKQYTDRLCSMNRWRQNNDGIIQKISMYFQNQIPYKCIFRIFPILRINGMAPFCNLFIEQPSYIIRIQLLSFFVLAFVSLNVFFIVF